MAARRQKSVSFINGSNIGSMIDIKFEVLSETKQGIDTERFTATVHYYEKGDGETVVLVHGIGQSLYCWRKNIEFLVTAGYRVIALDLPGFGYSTQPNIYYTIEENTNMLKAFLNAKGITKAHFIGFSTGALEIVLLSIVHPETVDKMVLVSPGGPNETYPLAMRLLTTKPGQLYFRLRFTEKMIERVLRELFFDKTYVKKDFVEQYYAPYLKKRVKDTLIMSILHFDDSDFTLASLRAIKKDTLVISGENDPIHHAETARLFAGIPNCVHVRIRNCGHLVNEEKPERFNSETLLFLKHEEV